MVIYSPLSSKTSIHKTGIPITALDINPSRTHAVLAGRDILKTIRVQGATCSEDFNLRSTIIAYASTHNTSKNALSAQHKDNLAANDVKWSHGKYDTTISTAAANGRIVLYDLNRAGVELARLHEHARQVHRVAFNPYKGAYLLSGSQDASIRLWDIRLLAGDRSVMTCASMNRYQGNNEGIRDLRWSPTDGFEFAAGTDNGVIQRWDIRNPNAPLLKINAHEKTCHSIDWHPAGRYLASGGSDKTVKVWDFSSSERRMKPCWQLRTPQAVLNARWRPGTTNTLNGSATSWNGTCIATSYDLRDPRIHVWDFCRPHTPFQELDRYDSPPSAILWHSENMLWSVGTAGIFTQTDLNFAPKPLERRNVNIVASAPNGQLCFFSERRARKRYSLADAPTDLLHRTSTEGSSGEKLSGSQSATEGSFEEPVIMHSSLRRRRQQSSSIRYLGTTPPSATTHVPVGKLGEVMKENSQYRTGQIAGYGHVLGIFDFEGFEYLARYYVGPLSISAVQKGCNVHTELQEIFEANALVAAQASQYRLAQTWRILGHAVKQDLEARAELALKRRTSQSPSNQAHPDLPNVAMESFGSGLRKPFQINISQDHSTATRSIESSSQMPTPLAKPVQGLTKVPSSADILLNIGENEPSESSQPPRSNHQESIQHRLLAQHERPTSGPPLGEGLMPNKDTDEIEATPNESFTEIEKQMHDRRTAIKDFRAKPREVLNLDELASLPRNISLAPRLGRHDSNESFLMFSASTDSSHRAMSTGGSFGVYSESSDPSETVPERYHHGPRRYSHSDHAEENGIDNTSLPSEPQARDESDQPLVVESSDAAEETLNPVIILSPPCRPSKLESPKIHLRGNLHPEQGVEPASRQTHPLSDSFIPSDFDPPTFASPNSKPWSATALIPPVIDFHLNSLSDVQFPVFLFLYLFPFFPFLFEHNQFASILHGYHEQLDSLSLFIQATELRKACYSVNPEIFEQCLGKSMAVFFCMTCDKPVKGDSAGYCRRCKQPRGMCPVCDSVNNPLQPSDQPTIDTFDYEIPFPRGAVALWWWCQECGHGGHHGCLKFWWEDAKISEGGCPSQGCLCDCMPGIRRDEKMKTMSEKRERAKLAGGGVARDGWVVGESKAVEVARGVLGGGTMSGVGRTLSGRSGTLSAGLGPSKRVRLLVPDDVGSGDGQDGKEREDETSRSVP